MGFMGANTKNIYTCFEIQDNSTQLTYRRKYCNYKFSRHSANFIRTKGKQMTNHNRGWIIQETYGIGIMNPTAYRKETPIQRLYRRILKHEVEVSSSRKGNIITIDINSLYPQSSYMFPVTLKPEEHNAK